MCMSEKTPGKIMVKFSMDVDCVHRPEDPDADLELVPMDIEIDDDDVPAYTAKCPKCGAEVLISFP